MADIDWHARAVEMESQRDDYLSREWQATKARMTAEKRAAELLDALRLIASIPNQLTGGDWEEIEDARLIARDAIYSATGEETPIPEDAP